VGLSRKDLDEHFCKVNNYTPKEFEIHEQEAFMIWAERGKYQLKEDFGKYQKQLLFLSFFYKNFIFVQYIYGYH